MKTIYVIACAVLTGCAARPMVQQPSTTEAEIRAAEDQVVARSCDQFRPNPKQYTDCVIDTRLKLMQLRAQFMGQPQSTTTCVSVTPGLATCSTTGR